MTKVVGIDEVGRGCWAGPLLVVASYAVIELPIGLKDSKLLSKEKRNGLFPQIKSSCKIGEGWVEPKEIDELGLARAMRLGVKRALNMLDVKPTDQLIIDGNINYCPVEFANSKAVVKADDTHPIVSAASIYAKVLRDKHMAAQAEAYPEYGFDKHVGYGTYFHSQQLKRYGPCQIHRQSFKPIKKLAL